MCPPDARSGLRLVKLIWPTLLNASKGMVEADRRTLSLLITKTLKLGNNFNLIIMIAQTLKLGYNFNFIIMIAETLKSG